MTKIKWENIKEGLCVICRASLDSASYFICNNCDKVCQVINHIISSSIMDVKSVCCRSDIQSHQKITCSNYCHDKFLEQMIQRHGIFKKVIDAQTGLAYKIPTIIIIEDGLAQENLKKYPLWD